ncbi:MAG: glutaredoxin 3, partial [PS1 clade bacterium]|nr:glutaredoxin 3 [PS1 clade bacterium]
MTNIEIYTTSICPFCHAAKKLLDDKGAVFSEISLSKEPELRDAMIARANGSRTVPQI